MTAYGTKNILIIFYFCLRKSIFQKEKFKKNIATLMMNADISSGLTQWSGFHWSSWQHVHAVLFQHCKGACLFFISSGHIFKTKIKFLHARRTQIKTENILIWEMVSLYVYLSKCGHDKILIWVMWVKIMQISKFPPAVLLKISCFRTKWCSFVSKWGSSCPE